MAETKLMSVTLEVDKELQRIKTKKMLVSKSAAISYLIEELRKCKEKENK
jgi:hypothetical protein